MLVCRSSAILLDRTHVCFGSIYMLVFASPSFLFIHKPISHAAAQKQNKLFRIFKKYSSLHLALITESEFRLFSTSQQDPSRK
jgi:hypothetical protein